MRRWRPTTILRLRFSSARSGPSLPEPRHQTGAHVLGRERRLDAGSHFATRGITCGQILLDRHRVAEAISEHGIHITERDRRVLLVNHAGLGALGSWAERGDRYDVNTIGALAATSPRGDHDEGGGASMSVGIDLGGEVEQALGCTVDDGLVAGELDLERCPPVWGLHDRVDLLAAVYLAPG